MRLSKNYASESSQGGTFRQARSASKLGMSQQGMYSNTVYPSNINNSPTYNHMDSSGQYNFRERGGKLKWKEIVNLDLDSMLRNNDLGPVENYLDNLIFSNIEENDLQIVPETSLVKLIKMFQVILEYLLYTQQKLETDNKILETNYNQMINDASVKETSLKENKSLINTLKKDKREKEMLINTYKCLIDEYKSGKIGGGLNTNNQSKMYYYCDICEGKKFSSEENLQNHMNRRHWGNSKNFGNMGQTQPQIIHQEAPNTQVHDKLDQIKTYFDTFIKTNQNESFNKISENQKNLENKINDIRNEKLSETANLERVFKSTLQEMKDLYLQNSIALGNNYIKSNTQQIQPQPQPVQQPQIQIQPVNNQANEETLKLLNAQAKQLNNIIVEMDNLKNERMQNVTDQLQNFKQTITNEFKELKQDAESRRTRPSVPPKPVYTTVASNESIEITASKKPNNPLKESNVKKPIEKTKHIFNSGPLESDHSDFAEENSPRVVQPAKPIKEEKPIIVVKAVEKPLLISSHADGFQINKIEKPAPVPVPVTNKSIEIQTKIVKKNLADSIAEDLASINSVNKSIEKPQNSDKNPLKSSVIDDIKEVQPTHVPNISNQPHPQNLNKPVEDKNNAQLNKQATKPIDQTTQIKPAEKPVVPPPKQEEKSSVQQLSNIFDTFVDREYDFIEIHNEKDYKPIM